MLKIYNYRELFIQCHWINFLNPHSHPHTYTYTHTHAHKHTCACTWPRVPRVPYLYTQQRRNVSPSLVLCDHFPGGGILELQTGSSWEWPFIVCLFWEWLGDCCENRSLGHYGCTKEWWNALCYRFNFYIPQQFNLNHHWKFISSHPLKPGMVIPKGALVP